MTMVHFNHPNNLGKINELQRWMTANGVNPGDVPLQSSAKVEGDSLTYEEFVRDERGLKMYGIEGNLRPIRCSKTVPLLVHPDRFGLHSE